MPRPPLDRSFDHARCGFLAHLKAREKSVNTLRCYRADLDAFAAWYLATMEEPLEDLLCITAVELREWKRQPRKHSPMLPKGICCAPR